MIIILALFFPNLYYMKMFTALENVQNLTPYLEYLLFEENKENKEGLTLCGNGHPVYYKMKSRRD